MTIMMIHIFMYMTKRFKFKAKQNIAEDPINLCGGSINFKEYDIKNVSLMDMSMIWVLMMKFLVPIQSKTSLHTS